MNSTSFRIRPLALLAALSALSLCACSGLTRPNDIAIAAEPARPASHASAPGAAVAPAAAPARLADAHAPTAAPAAAAAAGCGN